MYLIRFSRPGLLGSVLCIALGLVACGGAKSGKDAFVGSWSCAVSRDKEPPAKIMISSEDKLVVYDIHGAAAGAGAITYVKPDEAISTIQSIFTLTVDMKAQSDGTLKVTGFDYPPKRVYICHHVADNS